MTARQVSHSTLRRIVARASTLAERLEGTVLAAGAGDDEAQIAARLAAWRDAAGGEQELLEKRLAWDGLALPRIRPLLGEVRLADGRALPAWSETLSAMLEAAREAAEREEAWRDCRFFTPERPVPFEEAMAPFVSLATTRILARTGECYALCTDHVHAQLERRLLATLAYQAEQGLAERFMAYRLARGPGSLLGAIVAGASGTPPRDAYLAFVRDLRAGGFADFFAEYSALARMLAIMLDDWVAGTSEMLLRLADDLQDIQAQFNDGAPLGPVVDIIPCMSDPHNDRRSVTALRFDHGLQIVYKPKNLSLEVAYFGFLRWIAAQDPALTLKACRVVSRATHGWVEHVERRPAASLDEARGYYRRAGMLVALVYMLEGTDGHGENVIACGADPVLVDLEALLHFRLEPEEIVDESAESMAFSDLQYSVLRTGLLPEWSAGPKGRNYDASALGYSDDTMLNERVLRWQQVNTDLMQFGYETVSEAIRHSTPLLEGAPLAASDYLDDIRGGFAEMYRFLIAQRETLLAPESPLAAFARQRVRFIFRNTRVYGVLQDNMRQPAFLREWLDRSIYIERLCKVFLDAEEPPPFWPLAGAEQRALERLDVPLFAGWSDANALPVAPGQTIEQHFKAASYAMVLQRLRTMDEADLRRQSRFLEGSFCARAAGSTNHVAPTPVEEVFEYEDAVPLAGEELVDQAAALAAEIQREAILGSDGSATWFTLNYGRSGGRFSFRPVGMGLYDGSAGIALFLATLARISARDTYRPLCLAAVQSTRHRLHSSRAERERPDLMDIGGGHGLGSLVYTLTRIARLLDDDTLLDDARLAADLITEEAILADRQYDVLDGAAGAILGLLALHAVTGAADLLALATLCGRHLLEARVPSPAGPRAWPSKEGLLTGFSHGAAGIGYALLRLYEASGDEAFLDAAREAFSYERGVYSAEAGNWPDFRYAEPTFMKSWCHGGPGIALARLGRLALIDEPEIRLDVERGVAVAGRKGSRGRDHICCGGFGRIDVLLLAAQRLVRPDLQRTAEQLTAALVRSAARSGMFIIFEDLPHQPYSPTLFQGTAGIGYELLRVAFPERVPSVLLWDLDGGAAH